MTTGEMLGYTNRLNEITNSDIPQDLKNIRLASLMTDLEQAYQIPSVGKGRREYFEQQNPQLMQLYRTVSEERTWN